jgi:hypothetical protein
MWQHFINQKVTIKEILWCKGNLKIKTTKISFLVVFIFS